MKATLSTFAYATVLSCCILSQHACGQEDSPLEPLVVARGVERIDLPCRLYKGGAMVRLGDGRILLAGGNADVFTPVGTAALVGLVSDDEGKHWKEFGTLVQHPEFNPGRPTFLKARDGTLWLIHYGFVPGDANQGIKPQSHLWITSSRDDARTWDAPRQLYEGYTAGQRAAIETRSGNLVITFSYAVDEGRNVSASLVSTDGGRSWKKSQVLELGGRGNHSGALEPTVIELKDGRLWMLIRHQEHFWQAFSSDGGLSWQGLSQTAITTPPVLGGSPAGLIRLRDERLAMAWNPRIELPENPSAWRKHGRGTLAMAFSNDEGQTWSNPRICATAASLCYPHLLELSTGEYLLTTGLLKANEAGSGKRIANDVLVFRVRE